MLVTSEFYNFFFLRVHYLVRVGKARVINSCKGERKCQCRALVRTHRENTPEIAVVAGKSKYSVALWLHARRMKTRSTLTKNCVSWYCIFFSLLLHFTAKGNEGLLVLRE